jgi:hypothetical protein
MTVSNYSHQLYRRGVVVVRYMKYGWSHHGKHEVEDRTWSQGAEHYCRKHHRQLKLLELGLLNPRYLRRLRANTGRGFIENLMMNEVGRREVQNCYQSFLQRRF